MTIPKRLRRLFRAAQEQGWEPITTSKGHPGLRPPPGTPYPDGSQGGPVYFALTPSDHRGDLNSIGRLRRMGCNVDKSMIDR